MSLQALSTKIRAFVVRKFFVNFDLYAARILNIFLQLLVKNLKLNFDEICHRLHNIFLISLLQTGKIEKFTEIF